jgi:tetratricopeptide (TPR) repeat protein
MIVGRTPFAGSSVSMILGAHVHVVPEAPHAIVPSCPVALGDLVMQALEKDPELRPESAGQMRDALLAAVPVARPVTASESRPIQARTQTLRFGASLLERPKSTPQSTAPRRRTSRISWNHGELGFSAMVGRKSELSRVMRFCRGQTQSRVLVITGPPGVGKARLVIEAARRSQRATTYVAAADPSRLRTPWYPVLSILESALGVRGRLSFDDLTRAAAGVGVPERDMPGLAEIFALPGPAEALELAVRRREAHAAARRTLLAMGRRVDNAVLCFADLDRYDHPSAKLVHALCESAEAPLRIVVTARTDPGIAGAEVMELPGLTPLHARELAALLAGPTTAIPDPETVHALTAGSPAAIEQLAGWLEMGNVAADAPPTLVDMVAVRVNRLPAVARRVLQAVAIHGTVAPRWLAEACLGAEELDALEHSRWTGLLRFDDDEIRIPSELVAHVILECTPADVRRRLHWRALEALGETGSIGVLAHHAEQAGEIARAFDHSMHAGHDSVRRFDDPGASVWYGRAIAMARELHARGLPEASGDVIDASILLAEVLRMSGEPSLAIGVLDEAELFQPEDPQRARMERQRGLAALLFADTEAALHHLQASIGRAIRGGDPEFLCQAYLDLARALDDTGRGAQAMTELEQAIDLITLGQGLGAPAAPTALWRVACALAERQLNAGDPPRARATAMAALSHARRVGFPHARGRVSALLAQICEAQSDYQTALAHRANAIEEMRQLGDRRSTAELLIESANATRRSDRDPKLARWTVSPGDAIRLARELADEIGWREGVARTTEPT